MNDADLTVTKWVCPVCRTENSDVYALTVEPSCENCQCQPGWDQLLTPKEHRALNQELAVYMGLELTWTPVKKGDTEE